MIEKFEFFWNWYIGLFSDKDNNVILGAWATTIATLIFIFGIIKPIRNYIHGLFNCKSKNEKKNNNENSIIKVGIGIVQKENKVLLVKRRIKENKLHWQFPAGMIKPSEDPETVTIQEIKDETNVDCVIISKIGERKHPDTSTYCIYYHCKYIDGKLKNLDLNENSDAKWVNADEVKNYITSDLYYKIKDLLINLN